MTCNSPRQSVKQRSSLLKSRQINNKLKSCHLGLQQNDAVGNGRNTLFFSFFFFCISRFPELKNKKKKVFLKPVALYISSNVNTVDC